MNRGRKPTCLSIIVLAFSCSSASASVTAVWEVESYKDFDEGEAKAALITSLGQVKPGYRTERTDVEGGDVWAAVVDGSGTVYLGTDDGGAIYKMSGSKQTKIAKIPGAVAVVALALGKNSLYAGSMPGGEIWEVPLSSGKPRLIIKLKDVETVWSLAASADGQSLYAGTGPDGKLFRVNPASRSAQLAFETEDKRILAVSIAADGAVWFGTSEKAVLYRHDPRSRATRAMADFSGNEITAIAPFRDGVVTAANDLQEPSTGGVKTARAVDQAEKKESGGQAAKKVDKAGNDAAGSPVDPPRKGGRKGSGALWMVRDNGQLRQLHSLTQTYFTAVAATPKGDVFASAADGGRVYMVDSEGSVSTAFDVEERRVDNVLLGKGGNLLFVTSDGSALYRAGGEASKSTYTSKVFDAQVPSMFGRLMWWGSGEYTLETRSGYTGEPGKGWSEWQKPKDVTRAGANGSRGTVQSPPGRYFQYRVTFRNANDALQQTALYYLPQNQPTRVTEVKVGEDRTYGKLTVLDSSPTKTRSPVLKLSWTVDNEDNDETTYKLDVRQEGQALWRPIETGKPLTSTDFSWNTETFPDGYYRLRVTSHDGRANNAGRAREHTFTTPIFLIDNEKPKLADIEVRYPKVTAKALDGMSAIAELAYSIDDGTWEVGNTEDGLFDEPKENMRIELPKGLSKGLHTLAIRVADEAGNVGAAAVTFKVP
jgi:sugar lactone lactonase YvrE